MKTRITIELILKLFKNGDIDIYDAVEKLVREFKDSTLFNFNNFFIGYCTGTFITILVISFLLK